MARKTTTIIKFEVEKFDGKSNFLLQKMRVISFLVKEGAHKAMLGIEKKTSKMEVISGMISTFCKGVDHTVSIR